MQVTISINHIKAVASAMAVNDIRYYLNGILIEHNGAETRIVATDGHRLHAGRIEHKHGLVCEPESHILPDTLIKTICKAKTPKGVDHVVVLNIADGKVSALLPDGTESVAKLIDGKYPDYRRIIPEACTGEYASINPEYVRDAQSAVSTYHGIKKLYVDLKYNGSGCAVLALDGFLACIMPWRCDVSGDPSPEWRSELAKPDMLPAVFEHAQAAVDYANAMQGAA